MTTPTTAELAGPPLQAGARLRLATWNVHGFVGGDSRRDVGRVIEVLARLDADVIALQEVDARWRGPRSASHPLERAAKALAATAVAGPTMGRDGRDFGNSVLSRLPVDAVRRYRLEAAAEGSEPRGAVEIAVDALGYELRIIATHLSMRARERREQLDRLVELVSGQPDDRRPVVVCGDFNAWRPWAREARIMSRAVGPSPRRRTFPSRWPLLALDRIFVSPPLTVAASGVRGDSQARRASDHLPLWVDLVIG